MNPLKRVIEYQKKAIENNDSSAGLCFLSTTDDNNCSHIRIVELKDIGDNKFSILISSTSPKWKQLNINGNSFETLFYWSSLQIQIRINGKYSCMNKNEAEKIWKKKEYNLKVLDYLHFKVNDQSGNIGSLENYFELINAIKSKYPDSEKLEMPGTVVGLNIFPFRMEFRENSNGIPVREVFQLTDGIWEQKYIIP